MPPRIALVQQTQTPRPSPTTPQAYNVDVSALPRTGRDVEGLRIKLNDLREELQDAASRRRTVSDQLRSADSKARPGLEDRMGVLDARIVQIEKDISANGLLLKSAPATALVEAAANTPRFVGPQLPDKLVSEIVPVVAILSVFVLGPFALALSRFIWKRTGAPARPAIADQAAMQRLESLQQAVDTIAIEVERISEGQRFVTRLLSEKDRALGAGAAEPLRAAKKSSVPSERG